MSTSSILLGLLIVVFTSNTIVRVEGCNKMATRLPYFECAHGNPPNSPPVRCDGNNDCGDWSDEENCDDCYGDPYYCRNARTNPNWTIPEYKDCGPESDPNICKCDENNSKCDGFRCKNRHCLSPIDNKRCDGSGDCDDNSDEEDCDECFGDTSFYCRDARKCIPSESKCNGENDCGDWSDEKDCECPARERIRFRIVGGFISNPDDWPFMAALFKTTSNSQYRFFCGGAILDTMHILTAAHCLIGYTADQIVVRIGEHDFNSSTGRNMKVSDIRPHEHFNHESKQNDIAILKLQDEITFDGKIKPVSLPPPIFDLIDRDAYVIGWGRTTFRGSLSSVLLEVKVPIWTHERCNDAYRRLEIIPKMICAGLDEGGRDSCQGDSGGPLLTKLHCNSDWYIVGVVSFGPWCAVAGKPGIYTKVTDYLDWINNNMG